MVATTPVPPIVDVVCQYGWEVEAAIFRSSDISPRSPLHSFSCVRHSRRAYIVEMPPLLHCSAIFRSGGRFGGGQRLINPTEPVYFRPTKVVAEFALLRTRFRFYFCFCSIPVVIIYRVEISLFQARLYDQSLQLPFEWNVSLDGLEMNGPTATGRRVHSGGTKHKDSEKVHNAEYETRTEYAFGNSCFGVFHKKPSLLCCWVSEPNFDKYWRSKMILKAFVWR